jgi:hypothetical protein
MSGGLSQSVGGFLARLGSISANISPEYRARLSKTEQYRGNWRNSFRSTWLGLGRPDFHWGWGHVKNVNASANPKSL